MFFSTERQKKNASEYKKDGEEQGDIERGEMIIRVSGCTIWEKRTYFQKRQYVPHIYIHMYACIYIHVSIYTHTFLFVYWEGKGTYITSIVYKWEGILKESVFSFYLVGPGNSIQGFRLEMGYITPWGISLVSFSSLIHFEWVLCKTYGKHALYFAYIWKFPSSIDFTVFSHWLCTVVLFCECFTVCVCFCFLHPI